MANAIIVNKNEKWMGVLAIFLNDKMDIQDLMVRPLME
jgi:hypothetical protein